MTDNFQSRVQVIFEAVNRANAELERTRKQISVIADAVKDQQQKTTPLIALNERLRNALGSVNSALANQVAQFGLVGRAAVAALGPIAAISGAIIATATAMTAATHRIAEYQEQLDLASTSTGLSTGKLAALTVAAAENGRSLEQIRPALDFFTRRVGAAGEGAKDAVESFHNLGVRVRDTAGQMRPLDDILVETQRSLIEIEDPALRANAAFEVFGRGAMSSLAALLTPLEQAEERARRLGIALGPEAEAVARRADVAFDSLKLSIQGINNAFGVLSATIMGPFITSLASAVSKVAEFVNNPYVQALLALQRGFKLPGLPRIGGGGDQETQTEIGMRFKNKLFEDLRREGQLPAIDRTGYGSAIGPPMSMEMRAAAIAASEAADALTEFKASIMAGGDLGGGKTMFDIEGRPIKSRRVMDLPTTGGYAGKSGDGDSPYGFNEDMFNKSNERIRALGNQLEQQFASFVSSAVLGIGDIHDVFMGFLQSVLSTLIETGVSAAIHSFLPFGKGGTVAKMASGGTMAINRIGRVASGFIGRDTVPSFLKHGETVITDEDTSMLHNFLMSAKRGQIGGGNVQHVHVHEGAVQYHGVFANQSELRELSRRHIFPEFMVHLARAR